MYVHVRLSTVHVIANLLMPKVIYIKNYSLEVLLKIKVPKPIHATGPRKPSLSQTEAKTD